MKKKILSVLKYLLFLAIGGVLFWLTLRGKDLNKNLEEIKSADYRWIGLSVVVMILSHITRAIRWNQLLNTLHIKTKTHTTFFAVMIGYFVNNAVPRLGEITRCGVLSNHHKVPINSVIGTVIAERAFDMITMVLILILTIVSQLDLLGAFINKYLLMPLSAKFPSSTYVIIILISTLIILGLFFFIFYRLLLPKLRKINLFIKGVALVKGFWNGIMTIKNVKHKFLFLFYSLLMWGFYTLTIFVCFQSISATEHLTFLDALTIMALGSIGTLVQTPGGIGAYQYFVSLSLISLFLIEKNTASAFANLVYFTQWIMINIVGGISWIILFLSQKKASSHEKI